MNILDIALALFIASPAILVIGVVAWLIIESLKG